MRSCWRYWSTASQKSKFSSECSFLRNDRNSFREASSCSKSVRLLSLASISKMIVMRIKPKQLSSQTSQLLCSMIGIYSHLFQLTSHHLWSYDSSDSSALFLAAPGPCRSGGEFYSCACRFSRAAWTWTLKWLLVILVSRKSYFRCFCRYHSKMKKMKKRVWLHLIVKLFHMGVLVLLRRLGLEL